MDQKRWKITTVLYGSSAIQYVKHAAASLSHSVTGKLLEVDWVDTLGNFTF